MHWAKSLRAQGIEDSDDPLESLRNAGHRLCRSPYTRLLEADKNRQAQVATVPKKAIFASTRPRIAAIDCPSGQSYRHNEQTHDGNSAFMSADRARILLGHNAFRAFGISALVCLQVFGLSGCASDAGLLEPINIVDDASTGGNALDVSPDSRLAASADWAGKIRLWRLPEGTPVGSWRTPHGDVPGLMFLSGSEQLLSAGHDGFIRIWDLVGRLVAAYDTGSSISSFSPTHDRRGVLLGHANGLVSYWTTDGSRLGAWQVSDRRISAVAVDASEAHYAAGDSGRRVWRWHKDGLPEGLQSPPSFVRTLAFNPTDGRLLGGGWFNLFSWQASDTQLQLLPTAHGGIVNHVQFSANGSYLASISRQTDSAVMLLNPQTGETLAAFRKHDLCGQHVALSPDGRSMVSNSDDASVRFYLLPTGLEQ